MSRGNIQAANCGACGAEHSAHELKTVKLAGLSSWKLALCPSCLGKDTVTNYKEAIDILKK